MNQINPYSIHYIKLGEGGKYEEECIKQEQTIKIDFREVPHDLCINKKWDEVKEFYKDKHIVQNAATGFVNQLRMFYESSENTLWITFHDGALWWCFCDTKVILNADGTKIRKVKGKWSSNEDVNGNPTLSIDKISGELSKTQAYRGTICEIKGDIVQYAQNRINEVKSDTVIETENALKQLKTLLSKLIKDLYWKDFELLIDLIFTQGGWQKIALAGGTQKDFDLYLLQPITKEKAVVQIKSEFKKVEFDTYKKTLEDYKTDRIYYISHSEKGGKIEIDTKINLWFREDIVEYVINFGLINWIIEKTFSI